MVTILKPIDVVKKYVTDWNYWHEWGHQFGTASSSIENIIEATYTDDNSEISWQVSSSSKGNQQTVVFTDPTGDQVTATYTLTDNGASTEVERSVTPNFLLKWPGDVTAILLDKLKTVAEKGG